MLVLTTDLPFLTPEAISAFIDSCPSGVDVCVPLVSKEAFEGRFPGSGSQFVRLADGEWTIGCGFLVNPEAIQANRDHLEQIFAVRKSQVGMARLLGLGFIIRLLTHRLTVAHIEDRCVSMLGCSGKAVLQSPPELAFDMDSVQEYRYAIARV